MLDKRNIVKIFAAGFALIGLASPLEAYAWSGHKDKGWGNGHHHAYRVRYPYPAYGRTKIDLPGGFISVVIGGSKFYYSDGTFYRRHSQRYVVIPPPVGAVIVTLPSQCHPVIINGTTYYTSDGTVYYQYASGGYQVVPMPVAATVVQQPVTVVAQSDNYADDSFIVNIPNSKGGYTAVTLKRSGKGFIGPQGEFYPEFPRVEQLRVMYAAKIK